MSKMWVHKKWLHLFAQKTIEQVKCNHFITFEKKEKQIEWQIHYMLNVNLTIWREVNEKSVCYFHPVEISNFINGWKPPHSTRSQSMSTTSNCISELIERLPGTSGNEKSSQMKYYNFSRRFTAQQWKKNTLQLFQLSFLRFNDRTTQLWAQDDWVSSCKNSANGSNFFLGKWLIFSSLGKGLSIKAFGGACKSFEELMFSVPIEREKVQTKVLF